MIELTRDSERKTLSTSSIETRRIRMICNGIFYFGCLIIISCLLYILFHLQQSDHLVKLLSPIFISGLLFILLGSVYTGVFNRPKQIK